MGTYYQNGNSNSREILFFFFKSLIIKPTTLNTNEQQAIGNTVADPAVCVVSIPPKYQLYS